LSGGQTPSSEKRKEENGEKKGTANCFPRAKRERKPKARSEHLINSFCAKSKEKKEELKGKKNPEKNQVSPGRRGEQLTKRTLSCQRLPEKEGAKKKNGSKAVNHSWRKKNSKMAWSTLQPLPDL